jgi:hypothetical protein
MAAAATLAFLAPASPASALSDPGCSVTIQSTSFVTNSSGRFLNAQAKVYCKNVANLSYNWTEAGISIWRGGTPLTLEPNSVNSTSTPFGQARICHGTNTCIIYVSVRDASGFQTYNVHAYGFPGGPAWNDLWPGATADKLVGG